MPLSLDDLLNPLPLPLTRQEIASAQTIGVAHDFESPLQHNKRMGKACTQCRRDKSRCDNERPCNGCRRKGRAQLCVDGCYRCRHERLSCDDSRPCHQCAERGVECSDTRPSDFPPPRTKQRRRRRPTLPAPSFPSTPDSSTPIDHLVNNRCKDRQRNVIERSGESICSNSKRRDDTCLHGMASPNLKPTTVQSQPCRWRSKKCNSSRPCKRCKQSQQPWVELPNGERHGVKIACLACHEDKLQGGKMGPCSRCVHTNLDYNSTKECKEKGVQVNPANTSTIGLSCTTEKRHITSTATSPVQGPTILPSSSASLPLELSVSLYDMDPYHLHTPRSPSSFPAIPRYMYTLPSLESLGLPRYHASAYMRYDEHNHYNILASFDPPAHSQVALPHGNGMISLSISHIRSTAEHSL